jgi:hypothetical protein
MLSNERIQHAPKRPKDFSIRVGWMGVADFFGFSAKG